jgi:hypothetical protein
MRGVLEHARARDVDVRTASGEGRHHDAELAGDGLLLGLVGTREARVVVMVADRDVAFAGSDRVQLVGVAAFRRSRHVLLHRAGPFLRLGFAQPVDERAHEREVVDVGGGAHADTVVPFRVGERFVAAHLFGLHFRLVVGDDPGAHGEAEPLAAGLAEACGNARVEHRGLHRLEQTELLHPPQAAGVDRDEHVGRAARAFVADALDERVLARLDAVHLDAGLPGEAGVERLVGLVVARRVEVDDLVLACGRAGHEQAREDQGKRGE